MLNTTDNEFLAHVGSGTPMGELMRQYWIPAMLSSELPNPDSEPVRIMLLGEQLIGFRDTSGRPGLISNLCPTAERASSSVGTRRTEFAASTTAGSSTAEGNCVDMPNEPAESNFKSRVRATAYPVVERAGIIWTYMGPRETPPPLPEIEAATFPRASSECR